MSFLVQTPPPIIIYDPSQLLACPLLSDCNLIANGLFRSNFSFEANATSVVQSVLSSLSNCSSSPRGDGSDWLSSCNLKLITQLFAINSARVDNLNAILVNAMAYNRSCSTSQCRDILRLIIDAYTPAAIAASTSCNTPTCVNLASGSSSSSLLDLLTGGVTSLEREKVRFDTSVQSEMLQKLEIDTFNYIQCKSDSGCESGASSLTNMSFAVHGLVNQALSYGMRLSDPVARNKIVSILTVNFTRCVLSAGSCTIDEVNTVYRQKRAILRFLTVWNSRLGQIAISSSNRKRACVAPGCDISAEVSLTANDLYYMSDYLPLQMVVPAWLFYSLVLIAAVVISVFGFVWNAIRGKELFLLVCFGVILTCLDRLINFVRKKEKLFFFFF
jgi:hypothetical protein